MHNTMLTDVSAYYPVGFIAKTTGPRGEVIIRFEVNPDTISHKIRSFFILINKKPVPLLITSIDFSNDNTATVLFSDYQSKEEARQLTGTEVFLPEESILKKPAGIEDIYSLKGFKVENEKKKFIGIVTGFQDNHGSYLLEVISEDETHTFLIPLHEDLIKEIIAAKKTIRIIIPDGLLEL